MTNICIIVPVILFFVTGIIYCFSKLDPKYIDQTYNNNNYNNKILYGTSKEYVVSKNTCSQCITYDKICKCSTYSYYDCWNTDIKFSYGNDEICYYNIVSNSKSENYAYSKGEKYLIGKIKKLIKITNTSWCRDFKSSVDIYK